MGCGGSKGLQPARKIKVNPLLSAATQQGSGGKRASNNANASNRRRPPLRPLTEARCRALLIGCDYRGTEDRVFESTIGKNDVKTMIGILSVLDFNIVDRRLMFEEAADSTLTPTRQNIEKQIRWLMRGASEGDALFLMFSGRCDKFGSLLPSDHKTAGPIKQKALGRVVVGSLPRGVRMTIVLACDYHKPITPPLLLNTLWMPNSQMQFSPTSGDTNEAKDEKDWKPSRHQQETNRAGFRSGLGQETPGQVVMFFADQDTSAAKPQYVSQMTHPWKQSSSQGPAGSLLINALAQAVSEYTDDEKSTNRGVNVGLGALWEHMCRSLESRGYPGTPRMAFSAPVDLYAPFTMLPVKDNEFLQPAFTVVEDNNTNNTSVASLSRSPGAAPPLRPLGAVLSNPGSNTTSPSTMTGGSRCRSLFIGIEYYGTVRQRNGNVGRNDVETMLQTVAAWGFDTTDRCVLLEHDGYEDSSDHVTESNDHLQIFGLPTRKNIMDKLEWLVHGVKEGDSLFLFFSGAANCSNDGRTCELVPCENEYKDHDANITSRELCSILLTALRKHAKLTAIFTPEIPNPLRLPLEMHWAEGMNFCAPSGIPEALWKPEQAASEVNAKFFAPTKNDIFHEGTITVLAGTEVSSTSSLTEKFTHGFKGTKPQRSNTNSRGHFSSAIVQVLAQVLHSATHTGKPCQLGLGELVQRTQNNIKGRLGDHEHHHDSAATDVGLQVWHSNPPCSLYNAFTPLAGNQPGNPLQVHWNVQHGRNTTLQNSQVLRRISQSTSSLNPLCVSPSTKSVSPQNSTILSPLVPGCSSGGGRSRSASIDSLSSASGFGDSLRSTSSSTSFSAGKKPAGGRRGSSSSFSVPHDLRSGVGNVHAVPSSNAPHKSLFIGLSYFNTPTVKPNPGGCHDILTAMEAAQQLGFDITAREVLLDDISNPQRTGHPTKAAVVRALHWMIDEAQPTDSFLIVFSGHGRQDPMVGTPSLVLDGEELLHSDVFLNTFAAKLPHGCRCTFLIDASHSASICDLPFLYHARTSSWEQAMASSSRDMQASVLCIAATNDDEDRAHVDIKHMSHPWKYNTKGGALIHGWAEQVVNHTSIKSTVPKATTGKRGSSPQSASLQLKQVEMHLSYVRMLNAIQNHVTLRGTVLNHICLSSTTPLDMGHNFTLVGPLLPKAL